MKQDAAGNLPSMTRRDALIGTGALTAGVLASDTVKTTAKGAQMLLQGWDFAVENVFPDSFGYRPGDTATVDVKLKNTGASLGTVKVVVGLKRQDGKRFYPTSGKVYDIPQGDSVMKSLRFSVPEPSPQHADTRGPDVDPTTYSMTIDLWAPDGQYMFDSYGWVKQLGISRQMGTELIAALNWEAVAKKGALLGDWGSKRDVRFADTIPYFAGWLGASIPPYIDFAADFRDCVVVNSDTLSNYLDCGGLLLSGVALVGTALGVTSILGVAVELAEQTTDIARIALEFLGKNLDKTAAVIRYLDSLFSWSLVNDVIHQLGAWGRRGDDVAQDVYRKMQETTFTWWTVDDAPATVHQVRLTKASSDHFMDHGQPVADHLSAEEARDAVQNAWHVFEANVAPNSKGLQRFFVRKVDDEYHAVQAGNLRTLNDAGPPLWDVNNAHRWTKQTLKERLPPGVWDYVGGMKPKPDWFKSEG